MPSFSGLGVSGRLQCGSEGCTRNNIVAFPQNGAKVFAMRHRKRIDRLGRAADQRKALVRGLVTEVLRHGRITTTKTRAKAIRKYVDKMIQLAKDGSLHARRQALSFIYDQSIVKSLFDEAPARYQDRNGGYCRVITEPQRRRGDSTEMAAIELV
ncbi:50S ribosomal protein L17, chloroplastic [Coccomyxa sp. Obi]|nr:50S ribosomal protein L17, chloroplastic [Coccomyxa sp. Obi]